MNEPHSLTYGSLYTRVAGLSNWLLGSRVAVYAEEQPPMATLDPVLIELLEQSTGKGSADTILQIIKKLEEKRENEVRKVKEEYEKKLTEQRRMLEKKVERVSIIEENRVQAIVERRHQQEKREWETQLRRQYAERLHENVSAIDQKVDLMEHSLRTGHEARIAVFNEAIQRTTEYRNKFRQLAEKCENMKSTIETYETTLALDSQLRHIGKLSWQMCFDLMRGRSTLLAIKDLQAGIQGLAPFVSPAQFPQASLKALQCASTQLSSETSSHVRLVLQLQNIVHNSNAHNNDTDADTNTNSINEEIEAAAKKAIGLIANGDLHDAIHFLNESSAFQASPLANEWLDQACSRLQLENSLDAIQSTCFK